MLLSPCRNCLVKACCSEICSEKKSWDARLALIQLPFVFVIGICFMFIMCLIACVLVLMWRSGIISDERFQRYNPLSFLDQMDPYDPYY